MRPLVDTRRPIARLRGHRLAGGLLVLLTVALAGPVRGDPEPGVPGDDSEPFTGFTEVPDFVPTVDENCVVSIFNQTAHVRADGTFFLSNVPAGEQARARLTCVRDGRTYAGQTPFFSLPAGGLVDVPAPEFAAPEPVPASLAITAPATTLTSVGATAQLTVTALFPDGSTGDLTPASAGTNYVASNPAVATVGPDGLVTAVASGTIIVSALNEGALGVIRLRVVLGGDSDGDGIPDDVEVARGFDPNDPVDALDDPDRDGLTTREELVDLGTDPLAADTDGDGITDGEEVVPGADGFVTNPLLADTDADGFRDGLEIQTGSDPTDPTDFNLAAALSALEITPATFILTVNTILPEASRQLAVTGRLLDGTSIDLTSTGRGTSYLSSDLAVCTLGPPDGRVFAGAAGNCAITVTTSGFTARAVATVLTFTPTGLGFVDLPGFANNVDVAGDLAFVAAGGAGLQVVDLTDRRAPQIIGSVPTPGNANDVKVVNNLAFIADGPAGLVIVDVASPAAPAVIGAANTPGDAHDVVVQGGLAFVADGLGGLQVIDVANPAAPAVIGAVDLGDVAHGVDVAADGTLAVVAAGSSGLRAIDVSNPMSPSLLGVAPTGDARDVVLRDGFAFVADLASSFTVVDVRSPASPAVVASTAPESGGLLMDVALAGRFAFGADVLFVNAIPIIDVLEPAVPVPAGTANLARFRDDDGTGIAADGSFAYLTAATSIEENGSFGETRLYVAQYLALEDTGGVPPAVRIVSPASGTSVIEGAILPVTVEATDDVSVAAVHLFVDGQVVLTDTTVPFRFDLEVPLGGSALTLGAQAIDVGDNVGVADAVVLVVRPDPRTTATGLVVDRDGDPVAGATVRCVGIVGASGAGGRFTIPDVPTARGAVRCTALLETPEGTLSGSSTAVLPVPAGTTDVGTIIIRESAIVPFDTTGDLFVLDNGCGCVLRITPAGAVSVEVTREEIVAATGSGLVEFSDNGIAFDQDGTMYFADTGSNTLLRLRAAELASVLVTSEAITALTGGGSAEPEGITFGADGFLYVVDERSVSVLRVDPATGAVSVLAGPAAFTGLPGIETVDLEGPIVGAEDGTVYVASEGNPDAILAVAPDGTVSVVASGPPFENLRTFMTRAADGSLFVNDDEVDTIFRVTAAGGVAVFLSEEQLNAVGGGGTNPTGGLAFDSAGNLYLAAATLDGSAILRFDPQLVGSILVSATDIEAVTDFFPDLDGAALAPALECSLPDLTGTRSGTFTGGASGTSTATIQQSGSTLTGSLALDPGGTVDIAGSVGCSSLRIHDTSEQGIVFAGSVAGDCLSGPWLAFGTTGTWATDECTAPP